MSSWNDPELRKLFLSKIPLIDVRAPIEFLEGSIPHSINIPIMNDEERRLVGTCYKDHGQEAAIKLGHELVSGNIKEERIQKWRNYISQHSHAEVFCFRGGLRSQIACQWIAHNKKPVAGGYKRMRRFFLSILEEAPLPDLIRIGGPTGSGKSEFLSHFVSLDLEEMAHHRGSAFGYRGPQPSQVTFENQLALKILEREEQRILIEDESAVLGKITIPRRFFHHLRHSPVLVLDVPIEKRAIHIYESYVKGSGPDFFINSLEKIKKSLGGVKFQQIREELLISFKGENNFSSHQGWITSLLEGYYDPHYQRDLERQPGKILMKGSHEEIRTYLESLK